MTDNELHELATRKGVYPYDYMSDAAKFEEERLPSRNEFYNRLNNEQISIEDYTHAQNIWEKFRIKNLGEYHDLYLKMDVLLLADVFENFRDLILNSYKLDPAHYITAPGLSWDAMLRMTKVTLELLTDLDMHLMVEKGIRGGISTISNKYGIANNKYQTNYNPSMPSKYIIYKDANNLYGWSMSLSLPYGQFKWLTDSQIEDFNVQHIADDGDVGYILDVDLSYPSSLHDDHSDYPLAPEHMVVENHSLSPYSKKIKNDLQIKGQPVSKLIPNLNNKTNYIVHYRNLKFYLSQGLILTKIHRILSFKQSQWLKKYIDFNTEKRSKAASEFDMDFFKLMNNSVFGKTCENIRNRINVQLINDSKQMKKKLAQPTFKSFIIINENLCAVHSLKKSLTLNRPIYVGFTVLDNSKILMYDYHYNHIKIVYGGKAKLLFTDTDSLCYIIETEDIFTDMKNYIHLYDTSNYKKDHFLYNLQNRKKLGKFKDEVKGEIIEEFVGLRPKMYSFKIMGGKQKKTSKGVKKKVVASIQHQSYKDCLLNSTIMYSTMNQIRSYNHSVYSIEMRKISLSPFDDKRYVLENGIDTIAHGHYQIQKKC